MTASPATPSSREALYRRFLRHNRRIGLLRIAVPALAIMLLLVPLSRFALTTLAESFAGAGIRLESDTLVLDAPRFEGTTAAGDVYVMVAERAESAVGNLDLVELWDLTLDLTGDAGYSAHAFLTRATWTMSAERLVSNEDVQVSDSTGARGLLAGVDVDWPAQILTSEGPVRFDFDNGNSLTSQQMRYDIQDSHWWFTSVRLQMVPAPDQGADRSVDDYVAPVIAPPVADAPAQGEP